MAQRNINPMTDDELYASWGEWITRISEELTGVYNDRDIFRHVKLMFETNPAMCRDDPR